MMGYMKWLSLTALAALFSFSGAHAEVFGVKTVYVLPMAGGLDQYLALRLTSEGILQVVTDPKKADAIFTDGIGARLEDTLTQLYGAPVDKDKPETAGKTDFAHPAMQPLSRSRGVVFLVNRASRDVVWSTFERPKSAQPEELKHAADKIVSRLAKANKAK
ncbi:MAG: hypothetical protein JWO19_3483 [Bryobacterales bacterium]|nr:hypothetical protein [Bryobacterales bacterium]